LYHTKTKHHHIMRSDNINRVVTKVNSAYGAPMGRRNIGKEPNTIIRGNNGRICKKDQVKIYDKRVPMSRCGAYDKGGAYWGIGNRLRVRFTADLSYIEFYRVPGPSWLL